MFREIDVKRYLVECEAECETPVARVIEKLRKEVGCLRGLTAHLKETPKLAYDATFMSSLITIANKLSRDFEEYTSRLESEQIVYVGDLRIDLDRKEVQKGGRLVHLGPRLFQVLSILARSQGRVVSAEEIGREIDPESCVSEHFKKEAARVSVFRLKRALGDDNPENPKYIGSSRGFGYELLRPKQVRVKRKTHF